jgi:predicted TIM-barrel fold metal-dependent hydrolase
MALKFLSTPARYATSAHWVQLSLANMIFAGVFERHPTLKVVSLEHEIAWAPHFLQTMDYTYTQRARRSQWYRFHDAALPSDFFHRNVMISFQEDALGLRLRDVVGVGNLVWGSDYPHAESTFPHSRRILDQLFAGVPDAERTQILDTNATALYFS